MEKVDKRIEEAFSAFSNGNWREFSIKLLGVLYCLQANLQLEGGTVQNIIEIVHLDKKDFHLEENPDGTHTLYSEKGKVVETYRVSEVVSWIWRKLIRDKLLCEYGALVEVKEIKEKLSMVSIPYGWDAACKKIMNTENMIYLIQGHWYSFERNESECMNLIKWCTLIDFELNSNDKKEILKDVESKIFYSPNKKCIYCRAWQKPLYICYDPVENKINFTQEGFLLGINPDGTEWFLDNEGNLCSSHCGVIKKYGKDCGDYRISIQRDGVKCKPFMEFASSMKPFLLNRDGERTPCNQEDERELKWGKMISQILWDLDMGKGHFEMTKNEEKYFKQPYPFTWKEIEKHFADQVNIKPENMEKMKSIFEGV